MPRTPFIGANFVAHISQETAFRLICIFSGLPGANELRLVVLSLGNILPNSYDADQFTAFITNGRSGTADPLFLSVGRLYAVFRPDRFPLYLPGQRCTSPVNVVGMH